MKSEGAILSPAFADRHGMLPPGAAVICAVSGGADSVCLLHWLLSLRKERGLRLYAAHFEHGLRGEESLRDAGFVASLCAEWGVELFSGSGDAAALAAREHLSVEEAARRLRYAFFEETAAIVPGSRVATAHQAEDNAETMLMDLARGAGLRGLAGIPPVRGIYIRPLLQTERKYILRYLEANGLRWVEDSTNKGDEYARNRLRHRVMPQLMEEYPTFLHSASACAERLWEDEAFLTGQAETLLPPTERDGGFAFSVSSLGKAPRPLALRALRSAAERLGLRLSAERTEAVLGLVRAGPSARVQLPGGALALREYDALLLLPREPEAQRLPETPLRWGEWVPNPQAGLALYWGAEIKKEEAEQVFCFKKADLYGIITLRSRRVGDRVLLDRALGAKSLKKWMIEEKIPARLRDRVPVIADEAGVLALLPYGANLERSAARDADCVIAVKKWKEAAETAGESL